MAALKSNSIFNRTMNYSVRHGAFAVIGNSSNCCFILSIVQSDVHFAINYLSSSKTFELD